MSAAWFAWRRRLRLKKQVDSVRSRIQSFAKTFRLKDGSEVLVEVRVTPLDDGGV